MRRFLSFLGAIAAAAVFAGANATELPPAASQAYVPANGPATTVQAEFNRLHGLSQWRPIAMRSGFGPAFTPATSLNWKTQGTWRVNYQNSVKYAVSAIKLRYCNAYAGIGTYAANAGGEIMNANPITVSAGLVTNSNATKKSWAYNDPQQSTPLPVSFNGGQNTATIPGGYCADSDPIYAPLAAGQYFYVQSTCIESVADTCPGIDTGGMSGAASADGDNTGYTTVTLTCNGGTGPYTGTSPQTPVAPNSVRVVAPGYSVIQTDNGSGSINAGNGIASGTINYSTGVVSITLNSACSSPTAFYANMSGGGTPIDQSKTTLTNFYASGYNNMSFGPQAILGLPATLTPIRAIGVLGDSIDNGSGNSSTNISWVDYANPGYGVAKGAINGEMLASFANPLDRQARMRYFGGHIVDRVVANWATNDLYYGQSLGQIITNFLSVQPALAALTPDLSGADLWWVSMTPRVASASNNTPFNPASGPYAATGAAYGSGAVANATPLGGAYDSGTLGEAILSCTITGSGTTGPYSCAFPSATMVGSLWSDGAYTSVVDTGAGGAGATTLSGSQLSTGTHTPSTGMVSLTFANALATGQRVKLYAFASGPSARNAWNYFLYNYAVPEGLIGGVIDVAGCVEASPASAAGAGTGAWASLSYTADGTHPNAAGHQTIIPGCIGPNGTNPSPFWALN